MLNVRRMQRAARPKPSWLRKHTLTSKNQAYHTVRDRRVYCRKIKPSSGKDSLPMNPSLASPIGDSRSTPRLTRRAGSDSRASRSKILACYALPHWLRSSKPRSSHGFWIPTSSDQEKDTSQGI